MIAVAQTEEQTMRPFYSIVHETLMMKTLVGVIKRDII